MLAKKLSQEAFFAVEKISHLIKKTPVLRVLTPQNKQLKKRHGSYHSSQKIHGQLHSNQRLSLQLDRDNMPGYTSNAWALDQQCTMFVSVTIDDYGLEWLCSKSGVVWHVQDSCIITSNVIQQPGLVFYCSYCLT